MAGEENTINFWAVDAYGHATAQDGSAKIMFQVTSGTQIIPGRSGLKCMLHFLVLHEGLAAAVLL